LNEVRLRKVVVFMKNFLSKRKILIFFLVIIFIIPVFLVFLNRFREKAEFEKIMNMNNDIIPEIYNFDMSERPEEIGDIKIEYEEKEQSAKKWDIAKVFLSDANKAYIINTVLESNKEPEQQCYIIMDHPDYEILAAVNGNSAINLFPSGEVRVSSGSELWCAVQYIHKNEDSLHTDKVLFSFQKVQDVKVYPLYSYRNDLLIETDHLDNAHITVYHQENSTQYRLIDKYTNQKKGLKSALITKDRNGEFTALIDTNDNGVFDTNIAKKVSMPVE